LKNAKKTKKNIKQESRNRKKNVSCLSKMKTFIKRTVKSISDLNVKSAEENFYKAQSILDRYATKGIIHKNKSSRYKSSLFTKIHNLKKTIGS
jgi:small subunit ribosomal protein S20